MAGKMHPCWIISQSFHTNHQVDAPYQISTQSDKQFWRRRFLKIFTLFSLIQDGGKSMVIFDNPLNTFVLLTE
jgi:hypothetical protein